MAILVRWTNEGDMIDYTPSVAVAAGEVIVQADLVGYAKRDIAANVKGALCVSGCADWPKAAGSGTAIPAGTKLYWDSGNEVPTATAGSFKYIGKSTAAATDDDTTVNIRMSQ